MQHAKWDVNKLLAVLGGIDALLDAHRAAGFERLSYSAIASWRYRQSIPGEKLAELALVILKARPGFDLAELIRTYETSPVLHPRARR